VEAEFFVESAEKPGHAICEFAQKHNATFICTGTRGMGKIYKQPRIFLLKLFKHPVIFIPFPNNY
jgi:uncharacterized Zn-finger protein